MKRLVLAAVGIGILIGVSTIAGTWLPKVAQKPSPTPIAGSSTKFVDEQLGLELSYPNSLTREDLSPADKNESILLRLSSNSPEALVTVKTETGLKVVATATKTEIVDLLISNLKKAYPARYPGFNLESTRSLSVSGRKATEVVFSYQSPAGDKAKQRLLIIEKDDDTAMYVAAQARESAFAGVSQKLFEPVFGSIVLK